MARWPDVVEAAPGLARDARGFLDAGVHKTLATLRAGGAPRISGTEAYFVWDDLWFGSMWMARKARDLWPGHRRISRRHPRVHRFRADVREVLVVRLGEPADHLEIVVWNPGRGVRRMTRR